MRIVAILTTNCTQQLARQQRDFLPTNPDFLALQSPNVGEMRLFALYCLSVCLSVRQVQLLGQVHHSGAAEIAIPLGSESALCQWLQTFRQPVVPASPG